ncbi:MAG TPA: discoidin domain-containing protein [Candidatus Eisenbacteria bacterium]|nr:discoidin domain-containing protein [Candidatus Eisenbacteria bacterium]
MRRRLLLLLALAGMVPAVAGAADSTVVVDRFEDVSAWTAHPAEGVTLDLKSDAGEHGQALRMDVHFTRGTGYAVARRAVSLDLPADYVFRFRMRGNIPTNALEFKLVDSTGNNVWWYVRRDLEFPREWRTISTRKRQIRFAWGPAGGGEIRHVAAIEIAVTAGEGGAGSVWLDDFTLEPLAADSTMPPVVARASSEAPGKSAARAVDGDRGTEWRPVASDALPWIELDLGRPREFGGLDLRWAPDGQLTDYTVAFSLDSVTWTGADTVRAGNGGRDPLYLPESEARFVRVSALRPVGRRNVELLEATVQPLDWTTTPETYFTALARDATRGAFPRPYVGEQCAWSVIGPDAGHEEALLSEDGMVETGKRQFSIEPFLRTEGGLATWADVTVSQSLAGGALPEPVVRWASPFATMRVSCKAYGDTADPRVRAIYEIVNPRATAQRMTLYLALRPFQVNPPWQNIGFAGGTARVFRVGREGPIVTVNGDRRIVVDTPITRFFGMESDDGDLVEALRAEHLPSASAAVNPKGFACGVLVFDLTVPAGDSSRVELRIPLRSKSSESSRLSVADRPERNLRRVGLVAPGSAREVVETLYAQLGWILVNRDGGAIQPGSRNYDRSWIRDGALTSSALLRMGQPDVVRDFIEWFAPFQYENGKIPCCASDKGPDPVTENDSHGQFIGLVAEFHRHTGDRSLVERMWPHVAAAVAHMDSLRGQRRTAEWRAPDKRKFFGLLTPSISHEGYPNPMHSYWDDFFAYQGYTDAGYLAGVLGRMAERRRIAASRETFARDLAASVKAAMAEKKLDYVPGCAELGDFDATSTTVALEPTGAVDLLPDLAIRRTFERYWKFFTDRRDGKIEWDGFTPYEMRVIGSFVRLGWRDRANQALQWFMDYRNPPGWRQWGEVAYREKRAPKYVGDIPHTWVGSDFVRSVVDMFVYERGRDSALVVAAGVPWAWVADSAGLAVHGLRTTSGPVSYTMRARAETVEVSLEPGPRLPRGGIVVIPPARRPFTRATVNGVDTRVNAEGGVVVRALPARVVMSP